MRHRLATVFCLAAVSTPASLAQATGSPPRHVTLTAARASLPARITALHLVQIDAGSTHLPIGLPGCHIPVISLDARGSALAQYRGTNGPDTVVLGIGVHVYRNEDEAAATMKRLSRDQLACPRTSSFVTPTARIHTTETVSTTYSVGAWQGIRKLDHEILATDVAPAQRFRVFQTWLTRGNVLLQIDARITDSPARGALQWRWVKEAQARLLKTLGK